MRRDELRELGVLPRFDDLDLQALDAVLISCSGIDQPLNAAASIRFPKEAPHPIDRFLRPQAA